MIPVIGEVCDVASGVISLARGDMVGAGLSLMSAIPVVGSIAGGAKIVKNVVKTVDKVVDASKAVDTATDIGKTILKKADDVGKTTGKIHGNSLTTTKKAYGYALIDRTSEEILKFGETIHPQTRYSQKYLDSINANMKILNEGSKIDMHYWQHNQVMSYLNNTGYLPPMNINTW